MDILDNDSGAVSSPVSLDDLVSTNPLPSSPPPIPATRNQAAITSLVTDPANAQEHYNNIMMESQNGDNTTQTVLKQQARQTAKAQDTASLMSMLSDNTVPFDQKQAAVRNFNTNPVLKDTGTILHTNLLAKPSTETPDAEIARISTADAIQEIADSRAKIQSIVNATKAKADEDSPFTQFFDHAAGLIPFHNQITQNKILNDVAEQTGISREWWKNFTTYIRPGTEVRDLQNYVKTLPPEQQVSFAKAMATAAQNRSGFLYGNDNHHEAYEFLNKVFNNQAYGAGSEFMDNLGAAADMLFMGSTAKDIAHGAKNIKAAVTGAKGPLDFDEAQQFARANANTPSNARVEPNGMPGEAGPGGMNEPSFGSTAGQAEKAYNPNARGKQAAEDVDFTESIDGKFHVEGMGPDRALPNPVPKLTAPVVREGGPRQMIGESTAETMARLSKQSVTHDINPASPMEIAQNANPDSARGFHNAIVQGTDEMAEALTGVDKTQAIANNVLPQMSDTGTVFTRVNDIDRDIPSVNAMSESEITQARKFVEGGFENATGLKINDAMSSFTHDGQRSYINAVYEVPAGSFSNAADAIEQAKFALSHYGVTDDEIYLLKKDGVNHVPVSLDEAKHLEGDYKIGVKTNVEVNPSMLDDMDKLTVKRNWLDRFAGTQFKDRGSVSRYIFDAASMLDKLITGPATVAKDYVARFKGSMIKKASEYSDQFKKLPKDRQEALNDYFREANFKGIAFNQADLAARGFNQHEVGIVRKWRDFWDAHYDLENLDVVRSLRNQGYEYFKNANAELYARKIGRSPGVNRFYDPATDAVRSFGPGELDDLYNKGGTLARLRRPTDFGGETVEHMIIRNTPTEYSRTLRDSDKVLNKREGYYQITYKGAKFVDEVDANGTKLRTIAVAGDHMEAESFRKRMEANNPGKLYRTRNDERGYRVNSDEHWDVNAAGGRIAQRHRGQTLADASMPAHLGDMKYIESPAASAMRAASSISGRTVMRPMLETAAERFMKQYARVLPKDQYGQVRFPKSAKEIGALGEHNSKEVADARTTWEYLNYLRNGYINSMSEGMKAVFNTMADEAGLKGLSTVEKGLRKVGEINPAHDARNFVFRAYLATNPLRQILVQGIQAWRSATYNPIGWANGKVPKMIAEFYHNHALNGPATEFTKFIDKSGLVEAVKYHNMVASSLTTLADESNQVSQGINKGFDVLRQIGFDTGETANMIAHAAAVFERYKRLGRDMSNKDVLERAHSEIRALTYDMNSAGDMPYNQGAASLLLQFMQMPHKALLQYTGRRIDTATKIRMGIGDLILWGAPIEFMADKLNYDILPGDEKGKSVVKDGIVSTLYNHALNSLFEGTHKLDFSAFSPYGLDGWMKLFQAVAGGGAFAAVLNSPAAGIGLKDGSRVGNAITSMARVYSPAPWDTQSTTPERFMTAVTALADISSGFKNAHKAYLLSKVNEARDQYGAKLSDGATTGDVIAQAFGFTPQQVSDNYELSTKLSADSKSHKEDVLSVYKSIKRFYASQYANNPNPDFDMMTSVSGAALQYYENDPVAMQLIQHQMQEDAKGMDGGLYLSMLRSMNLPGHHDYLNEIDRMDLDDAGKKQLKDALEWAKNSQAQLDKLTKGN